MFQNKAFKKCKRKDVTEMRVVRIEILKKERDNWKDVQNVIEYRYFYLIHWILTFNTVIILSHKHNDVKQHLSVHLKIQNHV